MDNLSYVADEEKRAYKVGVPNNLAFKCTELQKGEGYTCFFS